MSNQLRIQFKRLLLPIFVLLFLISGCFRNPIGMNTTGSQYELFAMIWEDYEVNYPEFTIKGVDWKESFYEYSPLAEQVETTDELVMDVLMPMLGDLKDAHIQFRSPAGKVLYSYLPEINYNFNLPVLLDNYLNPAGFNGWKNGVGYCDPSLLPYLSINSWKSDLNMERIADFFEFASDLPAVIIDVRMNSGGSNVLCNDVAGIFCDSQVLSWFLRTRNGPGYDDVSYFPISTYPNSEIVYDGTVYLLIGDYSASSSEDFSLRMDALDSVVLLGDTTMGAITCPQSISLTDGWEVNFIAWSARDPNHEPVEGYGVAPDIYVDATEADFAQGIDPVLEYAIGLVNSQQ